MTAAPPRIDPLGRVPVQFRIGVVGHRWLSDDKPNADALHEAVATIWNNCSNATTKHTAVGLTIVSALAEGADRLVADSGRALGARLEVILPMPVADYEEDFVSEASRFRFRSLLSSAAQVAVVGPRLGREESYREAGERIVDRSDVILAVWDGRPTRGIGGTAEIIEYAEERGTPVRWLEARADVGVLGFRERADHHHPVDLGPLTQGAFRALDFFNSRPAPSSASRDISIAPTESALPLEPYYARADRVAKQYQGWLLRSSRAIYALAVIAVATVATQLIFYPEEHWLPWIEVVALTAITVVLVVGRRFGLLRRWLSARQFAERLRIAAVFRSAGVASPPAWGHVLEEDDWVSRAVDELWSWVDRGTPPPLADLKRALIGGWFAQQIEYHERTRARANERHRVAAPVTLALFGLSLLAALFHALGWFGEGMEKSLSLISIVAPTAAAAVSGYVGQREYIRRAQRSRQAAEALKRTQHDVENAADYEELHKILDRLQPELAGEAKDWTTTTTIHDLDVP